MTVLDFAFGYLHEGGAKSLIKGDRKILGRLSLSHYGLLPIFHDKCLSFKVIQYQ